MASELVKIAADFSTTLVTKVAVGATTATLTSATDDDGVALPSGTYGFTIDRNSANKEYFTATLSGTSLTNIKTVTRGTGVGTSGFALAHRKGAEVIISDHVALKRMLDLLDGTTNLDSANPLQYTAEPTFTYGQHELVTWDKSKDYTDGVAIAGAADASTTVKGISKLSVAPVSATEPIAVGDNDTRFTTQSGTVLSGSNKVIDNADTSATTSANKVYRLKSSGKIDATMLEGNLPAIDGGSLTGISLFKCGATSKIVSDSSTTQTIAHGLGKTPKFVRLTSRCIPSSGSFSEISAETVYDGTTQASLSSYFYSANPVIMLSTAFRLGGTNTGDYYQEGVVTFDATNISITWTKTGSPSGTHSIIWQANA